MKYHNGFVWRLQPPYETMLRNPMAIKEKKRRLRFILFLLVQAVLFCCIIFTGASPRWITALAVFAFVAIIIAAIQWREAGMHPLRICIPLAGWSLLSTLAWGVVFLVCANMKGLYGWIFGGMLFSLPLGIETASLLLALSLVSPPRRSGSGNPPTRTLL